MASWRRLCTALCALLLTSRAHAAVQGVFAHYMVGGMSSIDQALADVSQAQALGLDAFALNVQQPDASWTRVALALLFDAAAQKGFKLFFSMDMATIPSPSACQPLYSFYASHEGYYTYNSRPFLSTFRGGANPDLAQQWSSFTPKPHFIPNFEDHQSVKDSNGVYPPLIFTTFPSLDGIMAWETAWPFPDSPTNLNHTALDSANLATAHQANKQFLLPVSPFQSKHHPQWGNWYRRGALNLADGMLSALAVQPDFVEILTWNDAGEGHYFGNLWPESMPGEEMKAVVDGWDHKGWGAVYKPFVRALKKGVRGAEGVVPVGDGGKGFQGAFWYRPLLKGTECGSDQFGLGKPMGWDKAEDTVNVVIMLGEKTVGNRVKIRVSSGGSVAGEFDGKTGMNVHQVEARKGEQMVQVVAESGTVLAESKGKVWVTDNIGDIGGICNFNYQVVEIA